MLKWFRKILDRICHPQELIEVCWCGTEAVHDQWCRRHAPRCRSGHHFHGNCYCLGDVRAPK